MKYYVLQGIVQDASDLSSLWKNLYIVISSDLIILLNERLEIVLINDNFLDLISRDRISLLERKITDSNCPFLNETKLITSIKEALLGKHIKTNLTCKLDEDERFYQTQIVPTTFYDGQPGVTLILEDKTQQKKAEKALIQSEGRASRYVEGKKEPISIHLLHTENKLFNAIGRGCLSWYKDRNYEVKVWDTLQNFLSMS